MRIETEIKAEAARQNIAYANLAQQMGIRAELLSRSFNGKREMRTSEVVRAAHALNIQPSELWRRTETTTTRKEELHEC